jgi:hypothetical protein
MFTRDCSVNQSKVQKADGYSHNLAGIQPSNWTSFIPHSPPRLEMGLLCAAPLHKCWKMLTCDDHHFLK